MSAHACLFVVGPECYIVCYTMCAYVCVILLCRVGMYVLMHLSVCFVFLFACVCARACFTTVTKYLYDCESVWVYLRRVCECACSRVSVRLASFFLFLCVIVPSCACLCLCVLLVCDFLCCV